MTEPYVKDFQAFASNGAAGSPAWLREIREGAIARFSALGFPTTKQEAWRFTSVASIAETHFTLSPSRIPYPAPRDVAALSVIGGLVLLVPHARAVKRTESWAWIGGSVLLALTSDSNLLVFKPSNKEYMEVAKIKVAESPTWAPPIIVGNRVFVKDQSTLTLWTI